MLQIAHRWAKPQGERVHVPELKFLQMVPDWTGCGAAAVLATDRRPTPALVRPRPEGVLLPPGVFRLEPLPGGGVLPREKGVRDEEPEAAMVPSCRSSASDLRRHMRRRHFFSTSVLQYAVA